jgi:protein-serine/threonine kinase
MIKTIGHGTQGKIYRGESKIDETPVIIKIIDDSAIKSFNYVGKIPVSVFLLKILNNPEEDRSNDLFVKYLDHFHVEKTWILVTEHEGDQWIDLLAFLGKRKIPLIEQEIMIIFAGIIQALSDLQTLGFTHNDIKDSNILINSETLFIKLIDLDSCRPISSEAIPASEFAGTIFYASPEVRTGNFFSPEHQEIYSVGILLLSVIFLTRMPEEIEKHLTGVDKDTLDPHILPRLFKDFKIDISSSITKVIQSMISRKPSKRPEIPDLLGFVHGD